MRITLEIFFYLIAILFAAVAVALAVLLKQGPGAKSLSKKIANRDIKGGVKIIFTQRIFGFEDLGLSNHEIGPREKILIFAFIFFVIMALCFF